MPEEIKPQTFSKQSEWHKWLDKNHDLVDVVWLRFFKKASGVVSLTYEEALEEALAYGWIDSLVKKYDDQSWMQKFTPRREKSLWSKPNKDRIAMLVKAGRMKPAGLKEVERAKADGRWQQAYDSASAAEVPKDFLKELAKNKVAEDFFKTLNRANVYAITWRLQTAVKPETRERRMKALLEMLAKKEKIH